MMRNHLNSTITLTFGDQAENHTGMQKIGTFADEGFNLSDLKKIKKTFEELGATCKLIDLTKYVDGVDEDAYLLIIKKGVEYILEKKHKLALFNEQNKLDWDKKAFMYGRVVNKKARYNLCYNDEAQHHDYQNKKGTIVAYKDIPLTNEIRKKLSIFFGDKAKDLVCEGNYYYDVTKCGIGFHGDAERRKVIGIRLGASIPLHYQWFYKCNPVGRRAKFKINNNDIYVMSEKTTGHDFKKKNIKTLRHAAGARKFLETKK